MPNTVKFVDFQKQFSVLEPRLLPLIRETLANGDLVMRQHLKDFESELAQFVGTRSAIGMSNCTDALRLVLTALGIGPGDEVVTVSHTFVATLAAIHHVGAKPVLVDVGDDHNMDMDQLEAVITDRTRAILPVHLNGRVCRMDRLTDIAGRHNLAIVEDSAQALGGCFAGQKGGSFGVSGTFSFYPAKMLGAYGDGGAVTTNNEELANKLLLLRDHGRATKDDLAGWGFNCRLDNLQAAILSLKLQLLPAWIERRRELAGRYHSELKGVDEIKRPPGPVCEGPWFDVYQNYVIEADERDRLFAFLRDEGIETLISWRIPVHKQVALNLDDWHLPRTERLSERVISLPLHTELDDWQVEYVAAAIRRFYGS